MICKGTTHNSGPRLAAYMTNGKDGERAELWQMRGFAMENLTDAFRTVHVMAQGTRCEQPFFHVQVRNREGEHLTRQQWEEAANRIERMIGLKDQPRAIAFHIDEKTGHEHMHVAWSRIDQDTLTAKHLPFYKLRLKKISRELELHFGLEPVTNHRPDKIKYAPTRAEEEQSRRLGFDIHEVRNTIRQCWDRSDCGSSFQSALEEQGLILAQGDRRSFVVIDREGGMHALGKRILDVTATGIRQRLSDISRDDLPTVNMARAEMIEKGRQEEEKAEKERTAPAQEKGHGDGKQRRTTGMERGQGSRKEEKGEERKEEKPLGKERSAIRLAYSLSSTPLEFERNLEEAGFRLARTTKEEAERSHRQAAFAREAGRVAPEYQEGEYVAVNAKGQAYRLDERTTGDSRQEVAGFLRTLHVSKHESIQATQEQQAGSMHRESGKEFWQKQGAMGFQFQDEARHTTQRIEAPKNLHGPAAEIWNAYRRTNNAHAFFDALKEREFEFAVVTREDVTNSQIDRHYKTDMARQLPANLREGDIVVVAPNAHAYSLNKRTTGEDAERVQKVLADLDRKELRGVYDTVRFVEERATTRELERQAFRDLSRGSLKGEKDTQPKGRPGLKSGARDPRGVKPLTGAANAAMSAMSKTLEAASDAVASLFAPTLSPAQIAMGDQAKSKREAEAEDNIDFTKYTADLAQQRRQEQEREAARERDRSGRER